MWEWKKVEFFFVLTFLKYISTFQQLPLIHSSAEVCSNVMLSMQRLCETAVSDSFWHAIFHVHNGCETTVCDSSKCTHWLWNLSACCGMLTIFGMPWCLCHHRLTVTPCRSRSQWAKWSFAPCQLPRSPRLLGPCCSLLCMSAGKQWCLQAGLGSI